MVGTLAADGRTVENQEVSEHLGVMAVGLGAVPVMVGMRDQRSVAMSSPGRTLAAILAHRVFIAPGRQLRRADTSGWRTGVG